MSFEAVPCRFQSSQGPNGEIFGFLIRPAGETNPAAELVSGGGGPRRSQPSLPSTGGAPPVGGRAGNSAAPTGVAPVRVLAAGTPITVSGDNAPRYLVPANVSVPIGSTWSTPVSRPLGSAAVSNSFTTPPSNTASPCSQQPRSLSVCSSSPMTASSPMSPPPVTQIPQQNGSRQRELAGSRAGTWPSSNDSSTTPDSGIQSVPGSPPSHHQDSPPTIEPCTSVCEDRPDDEDYADMPRLIAIDQDEDFCLPGPSGLRDEHSTTGSECETMAPVTLSITPLMDNARAAEQLIQLDSEKALLIAKEIQKRIGSSETPPAATNNKRKTSRREPGERAKKRKRENAEERRNGEERREEPQEPQLVFTRSDSRTLYREAMQKLLDRQIFQLFEKAADVLQNLHIGERERHGRMSSKGKNKAFFVDWDALKKRKKREDESAFQLSNKPLSEYRVDMKKAFEFIKKKEEVKKEEKIEEVEKVEPKKEARSKRKRKITETPVKEEPLEVKPSRISPRTPQRRRQLDFDVSEKKMDLDYEEIPRSICEKDLPGWRVPIVRCGCTTGPCSSDLECINRALCVQCAPSCQSVMCINKKFWKDEAVRLLSASGPKSKKSLRTKNPKRAGEFLGEYAGEVVTFVEAERRYQEYQQKEEIPRILCLTSGLFVDATRKGNICRYVKHSCKPNSRLEVWSVNGHLRAGLFSLVELSSNTEITISMNGLLPVGRSCTSCVENDPRCCRAIKRSRNSVLSSTKSLSPEEEKHVREERIFLVRNRRNTIQRTSRQYSPKDLTPPTSSQECLQKVLEGLQQRVRRTDGSLPYNAVAVMNNLRKATRLGDLQDFRLVAEQLLDQLDDDDLDRAFAAMASHYLPSEPKEKKKDVRHGGREMDLCYLNVPNPVGSYNPDEAWPRGNANKRADAVRCECGSVEEDGKMLQCDACNFWLHADCIGYVDESTKYYQCRLCSGEISKGIPSTDVQLAKQPELRLEGCVYYKALVNNRNIQVRQQETVYLEKIETDEHKKILKQLKEVSDRSKKRKTEKPKAEAAPPPARALKPPGHRKDLRVFRVERLFVAPGGHRFVFGFYYARPHETICDPQRLFHRNEVFGTPLYDTLPLDAVVGRCVVLDPDVWAKGRPTVPQFKEEDVLICDYQIDRNQRSFEKIQPKHRYPINTQPYVFEKFSSPKVLTRDFTPFLLGERSSSRSSGRLSRSDAPKNDVPSKQQACKRLEKIISRL